MLSAVLYISLQFSSLTWHQARAALLAAFSFRLILGCFLVVCTAWHQARAASACRDRSIRHPRAEFAPIRSPRRTAGAAEPDPSGTQKLGRTILPSPDGKKNTSRVTARLLNSRSRQ